MTMSMQKNISAELSCQAAAVGRFTAGGTGDNTKITGQKIDRYGVSGQSYQSAAITAVYRAVLGASATLSLALELQDSADGANWNTAVPLYTSTVVLTDSGSGSTLVGQTQTAVDLEGYGRYVRFNPTPDLSAGSTDVGEVAVVAVLGGGRVLPAD